jgi:hypothetical protein
VGGSSESHRDGQPHRRNRQRIVPVTGGGRAKGSELVGCDLRARGRTRDGGHGGFVGTNARVVRMGIA